MALVRRFPALHALVVDIAPVCRAGEELVAAAGLVDRVSFHAAEFFEDPLPEGAEAVLACDIGTFDPVLYRKVRAVLPAGGRFVIVDQLAPAPGAAPPARRHWALEKAIEDEPFVVPTVLEIRRLLQGAGFGEIDHRPLFVAGADVPFDQGYTIVEARA